jgi:RNA-directed DNA polymerase
VKAQDAKQPPDAQADGGAPGSVAAHAQTAAEQHRWYTNVLRGHYGCFGMPHNWRALNGFLRQVRRIWFNCPRQRSQKNRPMGWAWFEDLTSRLPLPRPRITHPWTSRAV